MSAYKIWKDLHSILGIPILDSHNICLGVLIIDTNVAYNDARFNQQGVNDMLFLITKGIGRLLEGYH